MITITLYSHPALQLFVAGVLVFLFIKTLIELIP